VRLLERLLASLAGALKVPEGTSSPAAVLWTDADGQWLPLIRSCGQSCRHFSRWHLRSSCSNRACDLAEVHRRSGAARGSSSGRDADPLSTPRRQARVESAGDCPSRTQPLIELQYRGRVWHQSNGHDWTVQAFLVSDEGLGLDVARDRRTEEAFLRVLPILADTDASMLRGRRLDADDFDKLSVSDPVRDLLRWLNGPELFEAGAQAVAGLLSESLQIRVQNRSRCARASGVALESSEASRHWNLFGGASARRHSFIRHRETPQ